MVIADLANYQVPIEGTVPQTYRHRRAWKRDRLRVPTQLPASERDRLINAGAIAPLAQAEEAFEELAAAEGPLPPGEDGDRELASMSAADLIAYVGQHPSERLRVAEVEAAHKKRKTVLDAATELVDEAAAGREVPGLVDREF